MYAIYNNFLNFDGLWTWDYEAFWDADIQSGSRNNAEGPLFLDIFGTPGDDILFDTLGDDTISADAGNDTIHVSGGRDTINGGDGIDTLVLDNAGTVLFFGNGSSDGLLGFTDGSGSTFLTSSFTDIERIIGSDGDDVAFLHRSSTYTGDLYLDGGAGDDFLGISAFNGIYSGSATLIGGDGDDIMRGGLGTDSYDGGDGVDSVSLFNIAFGTVREAAHVDLRTGQVLNDGFGNAETMANVEGVSGATLLADTFHGNDLDNDLFGAMAGADNLYGYGGDDYLFIAEAGGVIDGGDGIDAFSILGARYVDMDVDGNGLYDLEFATVGFSVNLLTGQILDDGFGGTGTITNIETLFGRHLNDTLIGDDNDNILSGAGGDDILTGNGGNDTAQFFGGPSIYSIFANPDGTISVVDENGDGGHDILSGIERIEFLDPTSLAVITALDIQTGTAGDDTFLAGSSAFFDAQGGNDRLIGSAETDYLFGGDGDDQINGRDGDDTLQGGAGNDRIGGGNGNDRIEGGAGNDILSGVNGNDILSGGDGNDSLFGGAGTDQLTGGLGRDILRGNGGHDSLFGSEGADRLFGGAGNDFLDGGQGDDSMFGGSGNDTLYGSRQSADDLGADRLFGGGGNDYLEGNGGDDHLSGGGGDDVLIGDGSFTAVSAHGDDTLNGGAGNDQMYGYGGNDTLNGGSGADFIFGMSGDDMIIAGGGHDTAYGGDGADMIRGGGGNDILYGDSGDDIIDGGAESDTLYGDDGNDTLNGAGGRDTLFGGFGDDILNGGGGNDTLYGGLGDTDTLTGGSFADRFVFEHGFGNDTITDFTNNLDKIDFSNHFDFNSIGDVLAVATQVGADVVIALDAINTLTLLNFNLADLDARDFNFGFPAEPATEEKAAVQEESDSFAFTDKASIADDLSTASLSVDFGDAISEALTVFEALPTQKSDFYGWDDISGMDHFDAHIELFHIV